MVCQLNETAAVNKTWLENGFMIQNDVQLIQYCR